MIPGCCVQKQITIDLRDFVWVRIKEGAEFQRPEYLKLDTFY